MVALVVLWGALPAVAQVEPAIDAAEAWLVSGQNADGSFGDFERLRPRDAAVTVLALAGRASSATAVDAAATYLGAVPEANTQFRSQRALALAAAGQSPLSLLATIGDFRNGGGMGAFVGHQSTLFDTAFSVQALALDEDTYLLDLLSLLDYVRLSQGVDGGWGFAVDAPSELYFSAEMLQSLATLDELAVAPEVIDGVVAYLSGFQVADGGFGGALETAVAYRALVAAGVEDGALPFGSPIPILLASQQANGSWNDDAYVTAEVVRALRSQGPNLAFVSLTATPESTAPGGLVRLTAEVRNKGAVAAPESSLAVRRDTPDGDELATTTVPALAAGAETTVEIDVDTTGMTTAEVLLFALLDAGEVIEETDEADNVDSVRITLQSGPDLAVFGADVTTLPASPLPDESFDLVVETRNLGETEVASFTYRIERLEGGTAVETLASASAGPVSAGGAVTLTLPLTFAEGEHELRITLDPDDLVDEEVEDNNIADTLVAVVDPDRADLAISEAELTLTPAVPLPGDPVDIQVTVRNLGGRDATATVELRARDADDEMVLATFTPTLVAGDFVTLDANVTLPPEAFAVVAVADPEQAVIETDESNNRAELRFLDLPDLALGFDNIEPLPLAPIDGETVTVTLTVRNAGSATATAVPVDLYAGDPDAGGTLVGSAVLDEIGPAGNRSTQIQWTATGGATALTAVVDASDTIAELSERNNRAAREVSVPRATGPNLTLAVADRSLLSFDATTQSVTGTVGLSIGNDGDTAVGVDVTVRIFEDRDGDGRRGVDDPVLALDTLTAPLAVGESRPLDLAVDSVLTFHRSLVWAEVDPADAVAERREDDNRVTLFVDGCELAAAPNPGGPIEPIEEWYAPGLELETTPIVAQLSDDNGDGAIDSRDVPDIVAHTIDSQGRAIVALSGLDGTRLWTFRSSQAHPLVRQLGQVATADLDGDGIAEVIGLQRNGRLIALDHQGRLHWVSESIEAVGDRAVSAITIGDLDEDGVPEIAVGRTVLSNTGARIAVGTGNRGQNLNFYGPFGVVSVPGTSTYGHSVIADVDLDGRNELVAGDTLYRLNDLGELEVVWDKTVPDNLMRDGFNAVGQLDDDPEAEIVYVSSGQIMVLNHTGSTAASRQVMTSFSFFELPTFWGSPPTIADLDGDGRNEILVATATEVIAYGRTLGNRWRQRGPKEDFGAIHSLTAFDLDGDGTREVLFLDEENFFILDGTNGSIRHQRPNLSKTATEYVAVVDVDNDGGAEILLPSNTSFGGNSSTTGLHVLGHPSWQGARAAWNQYTYQVTNILLDGTVPSPQTPHWQAGVGFRVNVESPAPPVRLPNLTIGFPRVGVAGPEGVPVVVRIGNGGLGHVPAGIEIALYDGEPTGAPVATATTSRGLRAGDYEDVTLAWTVAGSGGAAVALIDVGDAYVECDETDNRLDLIIDQTLLPDLSITPAGVTVVAPSAPIAAGQVVVLDVEVENTGTATSAATVARLYDGSPSTGVAAGDVTLPALTPGETTTLRLEWDSLGTTGRHLLHVLADPDGGVLELDEGNNLGLTTVDLVSPSAPDLDLIAFDILPDSVTAGTSVLLRAEIRSRGTDVAGGVEVAFRVNGAEAVRASSPAVLVGGESRILEAILPTANLAGTLPLEARVDPDGVVAELDESNNTASGTLVVESSALVPRIGTDQPRYDANQDVTVTITVTNNGTTAVDETLDLRIVDATGFVVAEVALAETLTLEPGENLFTYTWNTGSSLAGTYAAEAELGGLGATAVFGIVGDVTVSATLFADRDVYLPQQIAVLTGAVSNLGANQLLEDVQARFAISGVGGEVFAAELDLVQLLPGASRPLSAVWEIANAAPGAYEATLEVRDATGFLLAYAATAITVEDSASTGAGLDGSLVVSPDVIGAGAPFFAGTTVSNNGNAAMPDLVLRLRMIRLRDGVIVAELTRPEPLELGETAEGTFGVPTTGLSEDDYLVTLSGELPERAVRLDAQPLTIARGVSVGDLQLFEGDSGSAVASVPVTLSSAADTAIDVTWTTADGTALAGEDYLAAGGVLTFAPGEVTKNADVTVLGDLDAEPNESFLVTISAVGVSVGDGQGLVTLIDEEGCSGPNLLVNAGGESAIDGWTEAGAGWRARFADPTPIAGDAYFSYAGFEPSAELVQEVDLASYATQIDTGGQTFVVESFLRSAGAEPDSIQLVVDYLDATGIELARYESAAISAPDGWTAVRDLRVVPVGTRMARVRLLATQLAGVDLQAYADALAMRSLGVPVATVATTSFVEGDTGITTVSFDLDLSCAAPAALSVDATTVDLVGDDVATAGVDYQSTSATLAYAPGATRAGLSIELLGDDLDEPDETFGVALSTTSALVLLDATPTVTILDDDGPVVLSIDTMSAIDESVGTVELGFSLSQPSGREVRFTVGTVDGTAIAGSDYQTLAQTLVLAPGETEASLVLTLLDDDVDEPEESFRLVLSAPQNVVFAPPDLTMTIADDDLPTITVIDPPRVDEGDVGTTPAVFTVALSNPSVRDIRIPWATQDNSAQAGADYVAASGEIVFTPGQVSATVSIDVLGDVTKEPEETFFLRLDTPNVGTLVDPEGVGTIFDDDGVLITVEDVVITEGDGVASVPVILSKTADFAIQVDYVTVDGSARDGSDYTAVSGTLDFPPGSTRIDVPVDVLTDSLDEPIESFFLELSNPVEAQLLDDVAEVTILEPATWHLNADGDFEVIPGCVELTEDRSSRRGSAWRTRTTDLSENFDRTFRVYLGTRDGNGADGIVFAFQNQGPTALGGNRFGMGWSGISPAVGVEIDTFNNSGSYDPASDHITVNLNGAYTLPQVTPVGAIPSGGPVTNIEDGQEHELRIVWNAEINRLEVLFDGLHRLFYDRDIVTDIFSGTSEVFWGFTGGNGFPNQQYFCATDLCFPGERPQLSGGNGFVTEGDAGTVEMSIPITLSCPSDQPVTVDYATRDVSAVAGEDYVPVSGSLTFAPGETSKWVHVTVNGDLVDEPDETFMLELSNLVGADLRWQGTGNIDTDDVVWHFNGDSREGIINGCPTVTRAVNSRFGSVWRSDRIDLAEHFDRTFEVYLGDSSRDADGMAFVLQNEGIDALGSNGLNLGLRTISPSLGIELDTSNNGSSWDDIGPDHMAVVINGDIRNAVPPVVPARLDGSTLSDDQRHDLRVVWNADTQTIDAYLDGEPRVQYTRDLVADIFSGTSEVLWGFTGANFNNTTLQYFCPAPGCFGTDPNPRISIGDVQVLEGDSPGDTQLIFPLTLSCPSDQPVSVRVRTVDGDATAGVDYIAVDQVFTFAPGEHAKSVVVPVLGDLDAESDETVFVDLSEASGGTTRYDRGTGTIETDDVRLSLHSTEVVEGDAGTITFATRLLLGEPQPTATTVTYTVSANTGSGDAATPGVDFIEKVGTVTIGANGTNATSATLTFEVIGDLEPEATETVLITLDVADGSLVQDEVVVVAIKDDDDCPGANLLVNPGNEETLVEGVPPGWMLISGPGWSRRVENPAPLDGTAAFYARNGAIDEVQEIAQDVDVSGFAQRIDAGIQRFVFTGWVRIFNQNPGDLTRMIVEYRDADDQVLELWDTLSVRHKTAWTRYGDLRVAPVGTRTIRVRLLGIKRDGNNNDAYFDVLRLSSLDVPPFNVGDTTVIEGESGRSDAVFDVSLGCASPATTRIDFLTADGTATAGSDYEARFGTLTFAPGELTQQVTVPVFGDTVPESDETFFLELTNPVNAAVGIGRGTATIFADEITLEALGSTVLEGAAGTITPATVTFTLSGASTVPVSIDYATLEGGAAPALAGEDFTAQSGTVLFAPGEVSKTITIDVLGDALPESDETFTVTLSNPINVGLGDDPVIVIQDDDAAITIADGQAVEGDLGTSDLVLTLALSAPTSQPVQVDFLTVDDTALAGSDYTAASGTITFAPGEVSKTITIEVLGDTEIEPGETFLVQLSNPVNATIADDEATGFILDDDDCPSIELLENGAGDEATPNNVPPPGWTEIVGSQWQRRTSSPSPFGGAGYFYPGSVGGAELSQDVDVSMFASFIDNGIQRFSFQAYVRTQIEATPDVARVAVDYLDVSGALIDQYDSGDLIDLDSWTALADLRLAPSGTRTLRVRLLARNQGHDSALDVYFDQLSLTALRTPTVSSQSLVVDEGDTGSQDVVFEVVLACAVDEPVTVQATTVTVDAESGDDFTPVDVTLTFAPGETVKEVPVTVFGDLFNEDTETLYLDLVSSANAPTPKPRLSLTVLDDDPTPFLTMQDVEVFEPLTGEQAVVSFPIRLSVPSELPVQVNYDTINQSATRGVDFLRANGTLVFAPFEQTKTVEVTVLPDDLVEGTETFRLDLSSVVNARLIDSRAIGTIFDDDDNPECSGPELLVNGDGEAPTLTGVVPDWVLVEGDAFVQRRTSPSPFTGTAYIDAGGPLAGELRQDVDVRAYATTIASGQRFRFTGAVRSGGDAAIDEARIVVEYRDGAGTVLESYDSGLLADSVWQELEDIRLAPLGTETIRVRLLASHAAGDPTTDTLEVYFDALSLVSLDIPTLAVSDAYVSESLAFGSGSNEQARFDISLSCAAPVAVDLAWTTRDGTARAGEDYVAASGTVSFPAGSRYASVLVDVLDDTESDPDESFDLVLTPLSTPPEIVFQDLEGRAYISDDDSIILDLALCMDGSGSISGSEFTLQLNGTAAAVEDPTVVPHNGTVRISVLQFNSNTRFEIEPIVIDRNNAAAVAQRIRSIGKLNGGTAIHSCVSAAAPILTQATPFSAKQIIDVSTDGRSDRNQAYAAANSALAQGVDVINAIGVGSGIDLTLLNNMVRPQPQGGPEGFVITVGNFGQYADAIAQKIQREANPDLAVTKTDNRDTAVPGEATEYVITVTNNGSGVAPSVQVDEPTPALLSPVYQVDRGTFDPATGLWSGVALGLGDTVTLTVNGIIDPAATGTLSNTVTVVPGAGVADLEPTDNVATDETQLLPSADLSLAKSHAADFVAGGSGRFELVVSNVGPSAAYAIEITDTLPTGLGFVAASGDGWSCVESTPGVVTCAHPGPLAPATSLPTVNLDVAVATDASSPVTNTATVTATTPDPLTANNSAVDSVTVLRPALEVVKTALDAGGEGSVAPGEAVRWDLVVTNTGESELTNVVLDDPVPTGTTVVVGSATTSAGVIVSESPLQIDLGTLASGTSVTVSFESVLDDADLDEVVNQASVTSSELPTVLSDDPTLPGDVDPTVIPVVADPELGATKVDSLFDDVDGDGVPSPGDVVRYVVTITNTGDGEATGVRFTDLVPTNTALVLGSVTSSLGSVLSEEPLEVDLGTVAPATSATVSFDVTLDSPFPLGIDEISNQGNVFSDQLPALLTDDPDVGGDADPTVTMVTATPRLVAEKTDSVAVDADGDGSPSPGDTLAYTITLRNLGNTAAVDVLFVDLVPVHTTLEAGSVTSSQGTVTETGTAPGDAIQVAVGELPVGTDVTIDFRVVIDAPIATGVSEIINQGAVASTGLDDVLTDDPDVGGEADPTVTPITTMPELRIEKTATLVVDLDNDGVVSPGDELLYTLSVESTGNTGVVDAVLRDTIPADTALVLGSVQSSQGAVTSEDPIEIALGDLEPTESAAVSFRVTVDDPFPLAVTSVANQAFVTSARLTDVPSDDPSTPEVDDPTETDVIITPEVSIDDVTVTEADVDAVFTVLLSQSSNRAVTVSYTTADGSAVAGADYTAASGTVTIPAGETSATIPVAVLDDLLDELDETFTVTLSDADGGVLVDDTGVGTILDDDPTPVLAIGDVTVTEGDTGSVDAVFAVGLSAPSSFPITADYTVVAGSATEAEDYTLVSGIMSVAPGSLGTTITVPVLGDLFDETDETFTVVLSNLSQALPGDIEGLGTILDDDQAGLSVSKIDTLSLDANGNGVANPGDELTYTITVTSTGTAIVRDVVLSDPVPTASTLVASSLGTDTGVVSGETPPTVTIGDLAPGAVATVSFRVAIDDPFPSGGADEIANQASVTSLELGTVLSDDPDTPEADDPTVTPVEIRPEASIDDVTVTEGFDPVAVLTVTLDRASLVDVSVTYTTVAETATADADYTSATGTLTIPAGETSGTISIPILDDDRLEEAETFRVELTDPIALQLVDASGQVTIADDEPCPSTELLVNRSAEASSTLPLGWTPILGAAWAPVALADTTHAFAAPVDVASAELAQSVDVSAFADVIDTGAQPFALTAWVQSADEPVRDEARVVVEYRAGDGTLLDSYDSGAIAETAWTELTDDRLAPVGTRRIRVRLLATQQSATGNDVRFDDLSLVALRTPVLDIADAVAVESEGELVHVVTLSCPLDEDLTFAWSTVDGTALADEDYLPVLAGTVTIPAGATTAELRVPLLDDLVLEDAEHLFVVLDTTGSAATAIDPEAIGVILDDDGAGGCAPDVLDLAGGFNLFLFGDLIQNATDAEGRVAAGGNVQLQSYGVARLVPASGGTDDRLVAGGNLIFTDGTVYGGNVVHGGTVQLTRVDVPDGTVRQDTPIDFVAERTRLEALSASFAATEVNGTTDVAPWGAITLTGTDAELNVFTLSATALQSSTGLTIDVPSGATALINVDGTAVTMQNFGFFLQGGAERRRVLFNLHQATSLVMQSIGVQASILAPHAAVHFNNGALDGSLIAASLQGTGESHHHPFVGCLPASGGGGAVGELPDFPVTQGIVSRPAVSVDDVDVIEGDTGSVDAVFTLSLSHPSSQNIVVDLFTAEGDATPGVDYVAPVGSTGFLPGERTIDAVVPVLGDTEVEDDEIYYLRLDRPTGGVLGDAQGLGTILDDDVETGGGGACVTQPFGTSGAFNVFAFGNLNQNNSDAEGRMAAGGHLQLSNYSIGLLETVTGGDALVAGLSLTFNNGQVHHGDVAWGTSAQLNGVTIVDGIDYQGTPIDFVAERLYLEGLADSMAQVADTGPVTIPPWNAITLDGTDPELNVFTVPASNLSSATSFTINVPAGASVLINVDGAAVTIQNFGFTLNGTDAEHVVFNLHQATSLVMQSIGMQGTVLAPRAAVQFNNGQHNGALIAASIQGNGQSNLRRFDGCLPVP
ncbi:MAG: Calx-beta domain-containing protein [Acidobacteriota bacterium]